MQLKFSTLLILFHFSFCFSQKNFDYHKEFPKILQITKDSNNAYYYDTQLKKYEQNDSTQTVVETLSLLIGYTAKPEYNPYSDLNIAKILYDMNEEGKFQEVVNRGNEMLLKNPFHIKVMIEMNYALQKINKIEEGKKYLNRIKKIFNAMNFSGDGSVENPIFALAPKDSQYYVKYFLKNKVGTMGSGQDENGDFVDILEVLNEMESRAYYFVMEHAKKTFMSTIEKGK